MREVRLDPANLVLLLSVRVATAAAVECRHELANAARAAEAVEESLRIETRALGAAVMAERRGGAVVLGGLKGSLGHGESTAGMTGLLKLAAGLTRGAPL